MTEYAYHPEYGFPLRAQPDRALMARRSPQDAIGRARVIADLHWADGTSTPSGLIVDVFKPTAGELAWRKDVVVVVIDGIPRRVSPSDVESLDDQAQCQIDKALEPPEEEQARKPGKVDPKWLREFFGCASDELPSDEWALEQLRRFEVRLVGSVLMSRRTSGERPTFRVYRLLHNWLRANVPAASAWAQEQREQMERAKEERGR